MTIRPIRELGDPVLRTPVRPGDAPSTAGLAALVRDLEETVDHPGRAGLAAPQIGVGPRVFSYNVDGVIGHVVNPVIVSLSEETQDDDEGCLSVPGICAHGAGRCTRPSRASTSGEPVRLEGSGLMARCLQHEVDHLDGQRLPRPAHRRGPQAGAARAAGPLT